MNKNTEICRKHAEYAYVYVITYFAYIWAGQSAVGSAAKAASLRDFDVKTVPCHCASHCEPASEYHACHCIHPVPMCGQSYRDYRDATNAELRTQCPRGTSINMSTCYSVTTPNA